MLRNSASWPLRVQRPQTVLAFRQQHGCGVFQTGGRKLFFGRLAEKPISAPLSAAATARIFSRCYRTGVFAPSGLPAPFVVMANQGRPFPPEAAGTGFLRKSSRALRRTETRLRRRVCAAFASLAKGGFFSYLCVDTLHPGRPNRPVMKPGAL